MTEMEWATTLGLALGIAGAFGLVWAYDKVKALIKVTK